MFTDMTPEQIAASTALGIGAASVGRPLVGRAGQAIGTRVAKHKPGIEMVAKQALDPNQFPEGVMRDALEKLHHMHIYQPAQFGRSLWVEGYGDNICKPSWH